MSMFNSGDSLIQEGDEGTMGVEGLNIISEATEALNLIDLIDPNKPLSEELSREGISFLRSLSQEVLECMEALSPGARASLKRILKDMPRAV